MSPRVRLYRSIGFCQDDTPSDNRARHVMYSITFSGDIRIAFQSRVELNATKRRINRINRTQNGSFDIAQLFRSIKVTYWLETVEGTLGSSKGCKAAGCHGTGPDPEFLAIHPAWG